MKPVIQLKTKVQTIIYQDDQQQLGKTFATSEKRITLLEASDILKNRGIHYSEILKVKYEFIELHMPLDILEKHIQN